MTKTYRLTAGDGDHLEQYASRTFLARDDADPEEVLRRELSNGLEFRHRNDGFDRLVDWAEAYVDEDADYAVIAIAEGPRGETGSNGSAWFVAQVRRV